ncbi:hypothetical protein [Streptomyces sp. CB03238]|uniref:hypothetical protein n=1 Tax=Streptomyces sp. CB03238 TaxID=1907777 RepID=UPI000A121843|nr:hypothetical protein [Streptomyces sp. CB03238]ORT54116.1 hypothetical protein BKD26_36290 [Streptomyces sp. CB03238]
MRAGWIGLWRWVAWGGIGLSLYAGWLTVDDIRDRASSERDISAACDRLVSGAEVMDLQGGMVRATAGDDELRLDPREPFGSCAIYKVPGPGKTTSLFTLVVRGSGSSKPLNWIGDDVRLEPFSGGDDSDGSDEPDVTAVADRRPESRPVGDGTLGWYGNWYTTIRAECGPGSSATAPKLLNVTARADYENVSAADRDRLARIARSAAEELTDRIGCQTQLPALPDHRLTPVPSALRPAQAADGSCNWFARHIKAQGQGRLPDRALAVPARRTNPIESCLLAVSPDQVRRIAGGLKDDEHDYARSALTHSPWWLRTVSYFGAEARTVGYDVIGGEDKIIKTGTAGHASGAWWASSICGGKPALHTLSSSYTYDGVLGSQRLSALFRAYVADITKQRGCTHVTYPDAKEFRIP